MLERAKSGIFSFAGGGNFGREISMKLARNRSAVKDQHRRVENALQRIGDQFLFVTPT